MTSPTLSVILPNYNHAACVAGQIGAVLAQENVDLELIVVDDASTDDSVAVIRQALGGDPRAQLVIGASNVGVTLNCERGRSLARGRYVVFPAADDRVMPGAYAACVNVMEANPQAGICFSRPYLSRDGGAPRFEGPLWSDVPRYFTPAEFAHVLRRHFTSSANVMRADAYAAALPPPAVNAALKWHSDWWAYYVLAFRHGCCYVPGAVTECRIDPRSYSGQGMFDWGRQAPVLGQILDLVRSAEFADIRPLFRRSGAFWTIPSGAALARLEESVEVSITVPRSLSPSFASCTAS